MMQRPCNRMGFRRPAPQGPVFFFRSCNAIIHYLRAAFPNDRSVLNTLHMKSKIRTICLAAVLCAACAQQPEQAQQPAADNEDTMYQVALLQSLMLGDFDGSVSLGDLLLQGDFGLGTFQDVAGEMVVLDGVVYQCNGDGTVSLPAADVRTPFSNVTHFNNDLSFQVGATDGMESFLAALEKAIAGSGMPMSTMYAVKVSGHFSHIGARSILPQQKPFPTLSDAMAKDQQFFSFDEVDGTLVGFFFPTYASSVNTTGWHFHFISDDHKRGGHVLDVQIPAAGVTAAADRTDRLTIDIPSYSEGFSSLDFSTDLKQAIREVESGE